MLRTRTPIMSRLPETRQSLLLELARRDDAAWSEFLSIYEGAIYRAARGRGLQDADARDVTQEVLAAVHRRVASRALEGTEGKFRSWLLKATRNISIDRITERARRASASGDSSVEHLLHKVPDHRSPAETGFDLEYRRSTFEWAAARVRGEVRPSTWEAFALTTLEGVSVGEASRRLGVSIGSIYTARCRVVARIRERVSLWERESPE